MQVLVAMDSFKGSLTSLEAGNAVKEAVLSLDPSAAVTVCPLADGGEGTVDALAADGGELVELTVTGPCNKPVQARYCILREGKTAVIEMAAAAGLTLVPRSHRDPMETTTFGVGEMIRDAIYRGCRNFIMGIGGSATNDGGVGMLSALGFKFTDLQGEPIPLCARGLEKLSAISDENALPELRECTFRVACDVTNPLCGPRGCSAVFGPQKGATEQSIPRMDAWLAKYARIAAELSQKADPDYPGAGAAGGMGFAFLTFLNARLQSGVQIILQQTGMEQKIQRADLVVTGEGCLDGQTAMGKAPVGVAGLAKQYGKKVIAFAGCVTEDASACHGYGINAYFSIAPGAMSLEEAMLPENAYKNLKNTATQVFRLLQGDSERRST